MKTGIILAGVLCASTAAATQTGTPEGPLGSYSLELDTSASFQAFVRGEQVRASSDTTLAETLLVPGPWAIDLGDTFEAGSTLGETIVQSSIVSSPTRLEGSFLGIASVSTPSENEAPVAGMTSDFEVSAEGLSGIADIVLTIDASASLSGFGTSSLTWTFFSDDIGVRGLVRPGSPDSRTLLFENVDLTEFRFGFFIRQRADTDAPVLDSLSTAAIAWSIDILPIPAPSGLGVLAVGGVLAGGRRR
ncbi:MAG: hypothetical protein ACTS22_09805 [Phycisphaerales bacterium]